VETAEESKAETAEESKAETAKESKAETAKESKAETAEESKEIKTEELCRVCLPDAAIAEDQFRKLWEEQDQYINQLELRLKEATARGTEDKARVETSRRENLLVMRLTAKEQEIQELAAQVTELKAAQAPNSTALRNSMLDPAINILIQKLTKECENLKKQAEDKQNELAAWKFTPDSATGKRLMAKCRQLYQENEDLGKMISSGRLAKLEGELALQKDYSEKMKQNQLEMDDFMAELDEDVEGMQSTIMMLQQQLRDAKAKVAELSGELGNDEAAESGETNKTDIEKEEMQADGGEKRKLSPELEEELDAETEPKRTKTSAESELSV